VERGCIRHRQHEPAAAESKIDQLVVRPRRLPQDVLADDAQVGRSVVDVRRHVGGAHQNHAHAVPLDEKLPPNLLRAEPRETRSREHGQRAVEQRACGDRDRHLLVAGHWPLPARRAATCSGGSVRARWPGADHATLDSLLHWIRLAAPTACHHDLAAASLRASVSTTARMPNSRSVEPNRNAVPSPPSVHAIAASMRGRAGGRGARVSISETRSSWTMNPVAGAGLPKRDSSESYRPPCATGRPKSGP